MTEVRTTIFDSGSVGRRLLRTKVWGRVPAVPLVAMLVLAGIAAAVLLGPSAEQTTHIAEMTPSVVNVPTEILYGDILSQTQHPFRIDIAQNSYSTDRSNVKPILTFSASPGGFPTDCPTNLIVKESNDGGSTYPTTLTGSFAGGVCTYTSQNLQTVTAGSTTPKWYLEFAVINDQLAAGASGTQITVTAQFDGS